MSGGRERASDGREELLGSDVAVSALQKGTGGDGRSRAERSAWVSGKRDSCEGIQIM